MRWEGFRLLRQAGEETTVAPEVAPEAQQIHIDRGWLLHRSKLSIDFLIFFAGFRSEAQLKKCKGLAILNLATSRHHF